MLKKKQWLLRFCESLSEPELFDYFDIDGIVETIDRYWEEGLSPGEAAEREIEFMKWIIWAFNQEDAQQYPEFAGLQTDPAFYPTPVFPGSDKE